MFEKNAILDTCALIWLAGDKSKLSDNALTLIENASIVFVSAISAWEIDLKVTRGSLTLPYTPERWFKEAIEFHKLTLAPLNLQVLYTANRLSLHHKDPADRFIIATAILEKAVIITADKRFAKYNVKVVI